MSTFQKHSNERKIKIVANEMIPLTNDIESLDVRLFDYFKLQPKIIILHAHNRRANDPPPTKNFG